MHLPALEEGGEEEEGEGVQLVEIDKREVLLEVRSNDGVRFQGHAAILYHILELTHHLGLALQVLLQKRHVSLDRDSVHVHADLKDIVSLLELFDHVCLTERDDENKEV